MAGLFWRISFLLFFAFSLLGQSAALALEVQPRFGVSVRHFRSVAENDAKASLKVWVEKVGEIRNLPVDPDIYVFRSNDEAKQVLQNGTIGGAIIATDEFYVLDKVIGFSHIFLTRLGGTYKEQMLLLAHRNGRVKSLADLQNRTMNVYDSLRMSLAVPWLEIELHRQGLPPLESLVPKINQRTKLTDVVLPVFFRQVDVCLVTRNGFTVMAELNPQLAQDLVVIAESEPVVPLLFVCHEDFQPSYLPDLLEVMNELDTTPAGRQVLMVFQCDAIREKPRSMLDSALKMLQEYHELSLRKK